MKEISEDQFENIKLSQFSLSKYQNIIVAVAVLQHAAHLLLVLA